MSRMLPAILTTLCLLGASATANAQRAEPAVGARAAEILEASVTWFAGSENAVRLRSQSGTLVVSQRTMKTVTLPEGESYVAQEYPAATLKLSAAALSNASARSGIPTTTCDDMSTTYSLCGVAEPWIWLIYDNPGVRGNQAVVRFDAVFLEHVPATGEIAGITGSQFEMHLSRKGGVWKVESVRLSGEM